MQWLQQNPIEALGVLIVLIGLIGVGWNDVVRFRLRRVLAVASVNFRQSIRRRVLWLTPLVIIGVVIVSGLQRSLDAQDAIRQTTTYCLFAAAMLMVLVTIILTVTNLPKEIESRVIYTVATKPVTRLEMVIGKVVGFAGITFCILLIMGVFSWGYLHLKDWNARRIIARQIEAGTADPVSRPTMEYYRDYGTLHAREMSHPAGLEIFAHLPTSESDFWAAPGGEGEIMARFNLDRSKLGVPRADQPMAGSLLIQFRVRLREVPVAHRLFAPATAPTTQATTNPSTQPAVDTRPKIYVTLYNARRESVVYSGDLGFPNGFPVDTDGIIHVVVKPEQLDRLAAFGSPQTPFYVSIAGAPELEDRELQILEGDIGMGSPETGFTSPPRSHRVRRPKRPVRPAASRPPGREEQTSRGEQRFPCRPVRFPARCASGADSCRRLRL